MRLLVLGGTGMLGHKLFQGLGQVFPETFATVRQSVSAPPFVRVPLLRTGKVIEGVDASDLDGLANVIHDFKPDYVLNCIGIIKQRGEDRSQAAYIALNALLPHKLCEMTATYGGRVIHFSTDCVFDGQKGGYTENDTPDALDIYGRTKALGELASTNGLTLRTSIIGRELYRHSSLLDWFLAQGGKTVQGYTRAIYSGITTPQMVKVILMILEKFPELTGVYQVVSKPISKFELLELAREKFGISVEIVPYELLQIDRSMCGDKFGMATGYRSPAWPQMMQDLADDAREYVQWGIWP